jgi:hypothetical protein
MYNLSKCAEEEFDLNPSTSSLEGVVCSVKIVTGYALDAKGTISPMGYIVSIEMVLSSLLVQLKRTWKGRWSRILTGQYQRMVNEHLLSLYLGLRERRLSPSGTI